jgi:hypothetical protein
MAAMWGERRRRRATAGGALLLAMAIILSGCGSTGRAVDPATDVISLVVAPHAAALEAEIQAARASLVSECMNRKGFHEGQFVPALPPTDHLEARDNLIENGEIAALPSEAAAVQLANKLGFGLANRRTHIHTAIEGHSDEGPKEQTEPNQGPSHERAYRIALEGPNGQDGRFVVSGIAEHTYTTQGCVAEAGAVLFGSQLMSVEATYLPEDLNLAVTRRLYATAAFARAAHQWSECMFAATGRTPAEPYNVPAEYLGNEINGSGPVSAAERAYEVKIAVNDTRCQYHSGFAETSLALRRSFAARVSLPYTSALRMVLKARKKAGNTARHVLALRSS